MLLGVLPIGDWSIFIILSIFSDPSIDLNWPGLCFDLLIFCASALYIISLTSVLLPEPDTPDTTTSNPIGILRVIFLLIVILLFTTTFYYYYILLPFATNIFSYYLPLRITTTNFNYA